MKDIFLFSLSISLVFVLIILDLVRKKRLKEQYSLLWLFFGFSMIVISTNSTWLDTLAKVLGVQYPPSLLFFIGVLICLVLILHITVVVSKQSERIVRLTQEVGILRHELQKDKEQNC